MLTECCDFPILRRPLTEKFRVRYPNMRNPLGGLPPSVGRLGVLRLESAARRGFRCRCERTECQKRSDRWVRCREKPWLKVLCILDLPFLEATEPLHFRFGRTHPSPYDQRQQIIADLPLDRLTGEAKQRILSIASSLLLPPLADASDHL